MRKAGFRFTTDVPDFINSNMLTDNVIVPESQHTAQASLAALKEGVKEEVKLGQLTFLAEKRGADYTIWPTVCPHEGAKMRKDKICEKGAIHCHWHGRAFPSVTLSQSGRTTFKYIDLTIRLNGDVLAVEMPRQKKWDEPHIAPSVPIDPSQELSGASF